MKAIDFSYFIERYISGEMNPAEKTWFEKELSGNDFLRKELNLRKKVDESLIRHDLVDLRNKLARIEKERRDKAAAQAEKKALGIRFAASVAVLMVIGGIIFISRSDLNLEKVYDRNFSVYESGTIARAGDQNADLDFSQALRLYEAADYQGAAAMFKEFLDRKPGIMQAHMYYGVSEMQNNNFPSAKSSFRTVIENTDNLYIDNAQWYLALCYIKTGEKSEAIKQLESIIRSESIFRNKAAKTLRRIK